MKYIKKHPFVSMCSFGLLTFYVGFFFTFNAPSKAAMVGGLVICALSGLFSMADDMND